MIALFLFSDFPELHELKIMETIINVR